MFVPRVQNHMSKPLLSYICFAKHSFFPRRYVQIRYVVHIGTREGFSKREERNSRVHTKTGSWCNGGLKNRAGRRFGFPAKRKCSTTGICSTRVSGLHTSRLPPWNAPPATITCLHARSTAGRSTRTPIPNLPLTRMEMLTETRHNKGQACHNRGQPLFPGPP